MGTICSPNPSGTKTASEVCNADWMASLPKVYRVFSASRCTCLNCSTCNYLAFIVLSASGKLSK